MNVQETERRVWNWVRWSREGQGGRGRCVSAEHNYVAPRADEEQAARKADVPVDPRDAELVERGIHRLQQRRDRQLLISYYIGREPRELVRRRLLIPQGLLEAFRLVAMGALQYQLEQLDHQAAVTRDLLAKRK